MAKLDLLNSAIAHAKEVKKTAMANAKITLEETFQPSLQRMISTKLQEEDEDFEEEDDFDVNIEFDTEEPEVEDEPAVGFGGGEEEPVPEEDDELNLEALIRELEGDGEEEFPEEDMTMEGEDFEEEPMMDEGDDMTDDDLMELLMNELDGEDMEELDEECNDDGGAYTDSPSSSTMNTEVRRLRKENAKLVRENNQAYKAVTELKKAINEVNLVNAKLMFITRTVREYPLTEAQQTRVLNSFDRCNSVREVKLVYTTIAESFNKKPIAKKKIAEGASSRPVRAVNPTRTDREKQNINEGLTINRFQQLAGIKPIVW